MSNTSNTESDTIKPSKPVAKTAATPSAPAVKKVAAKKATKAAPKAPASKKAAPRAVVAKKATDKTAAKPTIVATTPIKISSPAKVKQKLVRDSFTMPRADFNLINSLKERTLTFRRPTKKSELLRAGLHALSSLPDAKLKLVLEGLVPLKTGRPKKGE